MNSEALDSERTNEDPYWASDKKVFPTSRTTLRSERVRGKGRGGVTKWIKEEGFDLRAEQKAWIEKRFRELVEGQGYSREAARRIVEGQILEEQKEHPRSDQGNLG